MLKVNGLTCENLDAFIERVDALGGPNSPQTSSFWEGFCYIPTVKVDQELDPFSSEYLQQQLSLYHEISGRPLDQRINEFSDFDFNRSRNAPNPYGNCDVNFLSKHARAICEAIEMADFSSSKQPHVLDMGSGWGVSSELLAFCGCRVTAVDINHKFVRLVNERAISKSLPIEAIISSFDDFSSTEKYDAIFFYECLHHSVTPWLLLGKMANFLAPNGRIIISGEPINSIWWKHWGLRLDPLSIYCIRKFGWFESGFSFEFAENIFKMIGFKTQIFKGRSINGSDIIVSFEPSSPYRCTTNNLLTEFKIKIEAIDVIKTVKHGTSYYQRVRVENLGSQTIYGEGNNPVHISYHWKYIDGEYVEYDGVRSKLDPTTLPSDSSQITDVKILAPLVPGVYQLEITMVQEGVAWFEDRGSHCAKLAINVE